jgi:hypothetical protein
VTALACAWLGAAAWAWADAGCPFDFFAAAVRALPCGVVTAAGTAWVGAACAWAVAGGAASASELVNQLRGFIEPKSVSAQPLSTNPTARPAAAPIILVLFLMTAPIRFTCNFAILTAAAVTLNENVAHDRRIPAPELSRALVRPRLDDAP